MFSSSRFSPKIVLHLNNVAGYKPSGPVTSSANSYIKLSFKEGGETEVSLSWCFCLWGGGKFKDELATAT